MVQGWTKYEEPGPITLSLSFEVLPSSPVGLFNPTLLNRLEVLPSSPVDGWPFLDANASECSQRQEDPWWEEEGAPHPIGVLIQRVLIQKLEALAG